MSPTAPPHPCVRCGTLLARGQRCPVCQRAYDQARPDHHRFYMGTAWRRLRASVLADEPVCGCGRPTTEADHIVPRRVRPDLALERANVRAFCKACHSRRTRGQAVEGNG